MKFSDRHFKGKDCEDYLEQLNLPLCGMNFIFWLETSLSGKDVVASIAKEMLDYAVYKNID